MSIVEALAWVSLGALALAAAFQGLRALGRQGRAEHHRLLSEALGVGADLTAHLQVNRAILGQAQAAAAHAADLGVAGRNPYARGTREFVLWEAEYLRVLTALTEDRRPPGTARRSG